MESKIAPSAGGGGGGGWGRGVMKDVTKKRKIQSQVPVTGHKKPKLK